MQTNAAEQISTRAAGNGTLYCYFGSGDPNGAKWVVAGYACTAGPSLQLLQQPTAPGSPAQLVIETARTDHDGPGKPIQAAQNCVGRRPTGYANHVCKHAARRLSRQRFHGAKMRAAQLS